jgi:hypothetical protein
MPDDPISKKMLEKPLATAAELQEALRWRPELRGKSTRAIQMLLRRERRMKLAGKQSKAGK